MTNGEKLLATFKDSKVNTDFIWSVGLVAKAGNQEHTFIFDREWWNAEYQEGENGNVGF